MKRWIALGLGLLGIAFVIHLLSRRPVLIPQGTAGAGDMPAPHASPTPINDYSVAKQQIEETLKAQPRSYDLQMQGSEFYMRAGDYSAAIPHLQAAVVLKPHVPIVWIALGDANALSGHFSAAQKSYDQSRYLLPHNPQLVRAQGQLFVLERKWPEARRTLEDGLKRYPKDTEVRTVLGNLYLILNRPRDAARVIRPALEREPDRPDLHYMLGEAEERDLHIEAAIREMRETVRLQPTNAEAWGRIGLYQNNLTRYKEAREPLERAIALAPNESHYYWAMGDSYLLDTGDPANFDRAADLYRKALKLDPRNEKALYSFGMALTRRGRPQDLQEAVDLFHRLVTLNPIDMNAHFKLAETYRRLGRTAEAQAEQAKFQVLFAKGRHQTRSLYASVAFRDTAAAHVSLARKAMTEGDYTLAATEFSHALERDGSLTEARHGLEEAKRRQHAAGRDRMP
jgi:Flp pilus assembly protein TadD